MPPLSKMLAFLHLKMTTLSFEGAIEKYLNTIEKYHDSFEYRENESENVFKLINKKTC
jgi:hypothetical protein